MREFTSPNPTVEKQRPSILSPLSPFPLGSNDDQLERAQARAAARNAAIRRKATAASLLPSPPTADPCLDKQHILDLFRNCIKLASENKINQKNTWELDLIDHLFEIIKVDEEDDIETNFQKASCTLEAGVKIYSMRVNSVHSEAYKVLGAINRVGLEENEQDNIERDSSASGEHEDGNSKKEKDRKWSPLSTLESSFEVLNVKKFDAAFSVDPLYHQTSAQFDEGGAKGLLLNNLGVYGGCRVLFDSLEVPGKFSSLLNQHDKAEAIDISFAKECTEQMVFSMPKLREISPCLREIVNYFDEDYKRPSDTFSSDSKPGDRVEEPYLKDTEFNADAFDNDGTWGFDHDDQASVADEGTSGVDHILPNLYEETESVNFHDLDMDGNFPDVDGYLFLNLGFMSKQNAWAGPDHWKYRTCKGAADVSKETVSPPLTKKSKDKKQASADIDFTKALDKDLAGVFAPPKNPKALLLPANREPCNTTLPDDCHYQSENLVKLFLLPNVMCLGKRGRQLFVTPSRKGDDNGSFSFCDDETTYGDQFDDSNGFSYAEDSNPLVSQPRQVNKIEVQYDRTSKQVDVQALKETLWESLQSQVTSVLEQRETISFKQALAAFPNDCSAVASLEDISPHLCFICLLHLANEHGLSIQGSANLEDLSIHLPTTQRCQLVAVICSFVVMFEL